MHILFLHQQFPAQFGHIAKYFVDEKGFRCTFVSEKPDGRLAGIECLQYRPRGEPTPTTPLLSRTFEQQMSHSHGVFEALQARPDIRPDLIVAHSGFASALFLRELYDCPIINYFEYFYRTQDSDIDFRQDLPQIGVLDKLRARARNAALLLDLQNCDAGYAPTSFHLQTLPNEFLGKIEVIFDGVDTSIWKPLKNVERRVAGWTIPEDKRIVTYCSRGMEAIRGFDIFMKVAKRLCDERGDVMFLVVGEDRIAYGGDQRFTGGKTFKQWVLEQDEYDLERVLFLGRLPSPELARVFSLSDLHIYLTVPFILSWSLMNALACGATVLASDTAPVREMIRHGENGLLANFFDVDQFVETASRVLDDPAQFKPLAAAGIAMIDADYSLTKCLPQMLDLYDRAVA